jgi:hypothetical protein
MALLAVRERRPSPKTAAVPYSTLPQEAAAFCPGCKALQTIWLNGTALMPTRKFTQEGNDIYHDCGSPRPCHVFLGW